MLKSDIFLRIKQILSVVAREDDKKMTRSNKSYMLMLQAKKTGKFRKQPEGKEKNM